MEVSTIRGSEGQGTPGVHPQRPRSRAISGPEAHAADGTDTASRQWSTTHGLTVCANELPTITQGDTENGVD